MDPRISASSHSHTSRCLSALTLIAFPSVLSLWTATTPLGAAEPNRYQESIAPLFQEHCVRCHGEESQKSRLRLDQPSYIEKGGNSGEPLFLPGNASESFLYQLVAGTHADLKMPPKGAGLTQDELKRLADWINQGAALPQSSKSTNSLSEQTHWSFRPLSLQLPPSIVDARIRNPIDAFVLNALETKQLDASPRADRRTLIRRIFLVMLGLPPSPEEVSEFLNTEAPDAYKRLVERVLHSPHYGERWARHWLDVVRYADTNGYETNRERKSAYRYRDYVIDSFNEDRPYDQFIVDQLAGDRGGQDIGTGFLVAGPYDIVKSPDINLTLAQRQDELADMINTTSTTFLGLTVGCARCHNHKFDPIPQKDYYAMQAVFAGVNHGERALKLPANPDRQARLVSIETRLAQIEHTLSALRRRAAANLQAKSHLKPAVNSQRNEESFPPTLARFVRFQITATLGGSEPGIDELEIYDVEDRNIALADRGTKASASGTLPGYPIHQLEHLNDGQTGNNWSWIAHTRNQAWVALEFPNNQTIKRLVWGRDRQDQYRDRLATEYTLEASLDGESWTELASSRDRRPYDEKEQPDAFVELLPPKEATEARRLIKLSKRLEAQLDELRNGPKAWVGNFTKPPTTHRLYRGEPLQKREAVAPDGLSAFGSLGMAMDEPEASRRLTLARSIASPKNPLTARVIVNRLWHYIFGRGLAATPSDLGVNGIPPSHPALLDWLAMELINADWSIKHIQRLILTSHTFQQSSRPQETGLEKDAAATYLWRFPPRRLEAEGIRDSILAVSGALDLRLGGPGFYLHRVQVENVMHYFPKEAFGPSEFRRMVYLFKIRQEQDAIFGSFDCPDGNQTIPRRSRSNTPLQALNLFNSEFVLQQAEQLSQRLKEEAGSDNDAQIERAFQLFFARSPDATERSHSQNMIKENGLLDFCRALYNTSEFLFIF